GGVALIRAAAKNHERVTVVVDPGDYPWIATRLQAGLNLTDGDRLKLAAKAFRLTAHYDALIAEWMDPILSQPEASWPEKFSLALVRDQILRYGENPHQRAALYRLNGQAHRTTLVSGHAKPLSYNNFLDIDSATSCVSAFERPACVIVKHAGPSGVAMADNVVLAYEKSYAADSVSAFGGVIAFNRPLDTEAVETILNRQFIELLLAPDFTQEAVSRLQKWPRVRALQINPLTSVYPPWQVRALFEGYLIQECDRPQNEAAGFRSVAKRPPTPQEQADLLFAWVVARFVPSNAIVLAHEGQTRGIGGGQPNRVDSLTLARDKARRAGLDQGPLVLASDGFLPFPDVVEQAATLGVTAIIQPGGALRDQKVIA
ncbi:bifunctional phosphoribosylaminoimidazolecarboxamide formyltransferase/IMP cyclohydrolase, partial [mine drainage metagenome]